MVVTQQYLIREDRPQHLRPVVPQAAVPGPLQPQRLRQPFVKRLDRLAPPPVDPPPPPACSKLLPPLPALLRRPGLLPRAVARVLRADKAPARRSAFAVLLKRLLVSVHIIGTVRRDVERRRRQRGDLRGKGTGFAGAGGIHRGQQGPDHAAGS